MDSMTLEPSVDFALIADAVQAVGGKLYVMGGGWDTLWVRSTPARHHSLAIGVRIRIPWTHAGVPLSVSIDLQDEDGQSVFKSGPLLHRLTVQRPSGLPDGSDIGVVRAFTFNNVPFLKAGGFSFVIAIDGAERKRIRFGVRQRPQGPGRQGDDQP